jgi:hypothetical protein
MIDMMRRGDGELDRRLASGFVLLEWPNARGESRYILLR